MDKVPANKHACDLYLRPQYPLKACNLPFGYNLFIVPLKTDTMPSLLGKLRNPPGASPDTPHAMCTFGPPLPLLGGIVLPLSCTTTSAWLPRAPCELLLDLLEFI